MIQVLNRGLDILEYCSKRPEKEHSLSDIADHLGLNHATCANILKTLVYRKYIEQMGYKKGYRLGRMAYYVTGNISFRGNLVDLAKPVMGELCDLLNETVILAVYNMQSNQRIILHVEYCDHELQVRSSKEKSAYDTSTGRLIMAYLPEDDLQVVVRQKGLPTPFIWKEASASFDDLNREMAKIREKGIAYQTAASHIIGVAVPIFNKERVIASLGIYVPKIRFVGDLKSLIIDQLTHAAKKLSLS